MITYQQIKQWEADIAHFRKQIAELNEKLTAVTAERDQERKYRADYEQVLVTVRDKLSAAEQQRDTARALLAETLRPGAYGVGSTLAARIDAAMSAPEK